MFVYFTVRDVRPQEGLMITCRNCDVIFVLCRSCWRGQVYCSGHCRFTSRQFSLLRARDKYANSKKGKLNHILRQRRYRLQNKKINTFHKKSETDQSSFPAHILANPPSRDFCLRCNCQIVRIVRKVFCGKGGNERKGSELLDSC